MTTKSYSILLAFVMLAACWACPAVQADGDDKKPSAPDKKEGATNSAGEAGESKDKKPEPAVKRDEDGNIVLKMEMDEARHAGIAVEPIQATELSPETKAYGKVWDATPLAALVSEMALDRAAAMASSNELVRVKLLSQSGNSSERVIQTAESAALRDQLTLNAAMDRLTLQFGKTFSARNDLESLSRAFSSGEAALIKAELPAGETSPADIKTARVLNLQGKLIQAESVGKFPVVDPQTQGRGWMLLIRTNTLELHAGEFVTAYLQSEGGSKAGFFIPESAVVRVDGKPWVYVQSDKEHYIRMEIKADVPVTGGWFVPGGFKAGDKLVTTGAQAAYSEEIKGAIAADPD